MTRLLTQAFAAAMFAIAGCSHPTYFEQPLGPPGTVAYDERLLGDWVARTDDNAILRLVIAPDGSETGANLLSVTATITAVSREGSGEVLTGRFSRIAHASEIGGETYYNIRAVDPGSMFVALGDAGPRTPAPAETDWFNRPAHAAQEYWIAKAEVTGDGALWLTFIAVNGWAKTPESNEALEQFLADHGGKAVYRMEECGEYCDYARSSLAPEELAEAVRSFPPEDVFNLRAGPFVRLSAAIPAYEMPR